MAKTATRKGVDEGRGTSEQASPEASPSSVGRNPTRTDWEAVERVYRAGVLSLREIAKQHGLTDGAIRKRAKRDGWQRDLTAKVQEAVRSELVRSPVRTETPDEKVRTEREIVVEAAATVVHLVREHQGEIRRGRRMAETLMGQLEQAAANREEIELEIHAETAGDKDGKRRGFMLRAVSLPAHVGTLKDLATAYKTLIGLERQAFNLDNGVPDEPEQPGQGAPVTMPALDVMAARIAARLGNGSAKPAEH